MNKGQITKCVGAMRHGKSDMRRTRFARCVTLILVSLFLWAPPGYGAGEPTELVIEAPGHVMGSGAGGSSFSKTFEMPEGFENAILDFDVQGPNYESAPSATLNGRSAGSIKPFFPNLNFGSPGWQTNPDDSHDYNGLIHVTIPVTSLLVAGRTHLRG